MKTQQTKPQRIRNIGAAICAILLSLAMVALLAGLGSNEAQAETGDGEMILKPAKTEYTWVGQYATATKSGSMQDPETQKTIVVISGSYAMSSSGWVDLRPYGYRVEVDDEGKERACVDAGSVSALRNAGVFDGPQGSVESDIKWQDLFTATEIPDSSIETETREDNKSETKLPETEWVPNGSSGETPPSTPDVPKNQTTSEPADATTSNPQETDGIVKMPDQAEPEIFSLQCRQSEVEAKIAELEAQGYEIVRVEKLPKWWRQR